MDRKGALVCFQNSFNILLCVIDGTGLTDHIDLDLTGVLQLGFNFLGNFTGEQNHLGIGNLFRIDDDTDLAACLNGIRTGHTGGSICDLFQLFQSLNVRFEVLAARTRTGSGNGIGCLYQTSNNGFRLNVAVMRLYCVNNVVVLAVSLAEVNTDVNV